MKTKEISTVDIDTRIEKLLGGYSIIEINHLYQHEKDKPKLLKEITALIREVAEEMLDNIEKEYDKEYQRECKITKQVRITPYTIFHKLFDDQRTKLNKILGKEK